MGKIRRYFSMKNLAPGHHKSAKLRTSLSVDEISPPTAFFLSEGIKTCLSFVVNSGKINAHPADKNLLEKCIDADCYEENEFFSWIMACYKAATCLKDEDAWEKRRYIFNYLTTILQRPPPDHLSPPECEQYQKIYLLTLQRMMRFKVQDMAHGQAEYKENADEHMDMNRYTVIDYAEKIEQVLENSTLFVETIPANLLWSLYFSKAVYFLAANNYEYALRDFNHCKTLLHDESLNISIEEKIYFLEGFITCSMHYAHFTEADFFLNSLATEVQKVGSHSIEEAFPSFSSYKGICCFSARRYAKALEYFNTYREQLETKESTTPLSHYEHIQSWAIYLLSALAKYQTKSSTSQEAQETINEILSALEAHPEQRNEAAIITKKILSTSPDFSMFCDTFPALQELLLPNQPLSTPTRMQKV